VIAAGRRRARAGRFPAERHGTPGLGATAFLVEIGLAARDTCIRRAIGISTVGGNVRSTAGGIRTVKAKINTESGDGGVLAIEGDKRNVHLGAETELGKGNVTFIVPG
jgi:hypothetical protein